MNSTVPMALLVALVTLACTDAGGPDRTTAVSPCSSDEIIVGDDCWPQAAPPAWVCPPTAYNSGDTCDCECGVPDPDCLQPLMPVTGCDDFEVAFCGFGGECQGERRWTCDPSYLGSSDGCDCGCGKVDPDCPQPLTPAQCDFDNCQGDEVADASNPAICLPPTVPDGWTCAASSLNNGSCDCGCGAPDPECGSSMATAQCDYQHCESGHRLDGTQIGCQPIVAPTGWTCGTYYLENGSCDCGCGALDHECGTTMTGASCSSEHCPSGMRLHPFDKGKCEPIPVPDGWTCSADWFEDGSCDCGCGAVDPDCGAFPSLAQCGYDNGCGANGHVDPSNPIACLPNPSGWDCAGRELTDGDCDCGCGAVDPDCPSGFGLAECEEEHCSYFKDPDPLSPAQCISDAPQNDWTCDMDLLADGSQCDCGCGAPDPDCGPDAACDLNHCADEEELSEDQGSCLEVCEPLQESVGEATCTNGSEVDFSFGGASACTKELYSCTDGRRYAIECDGGVCTCSVNGQCVGRVSAYSCNPNYTCGWSLVDDT